MRYTSSTAHRTFCAIAVALFAIPVPVALTGQPSQGPAAWYFRSEKQADLWFHGLAVIGFRGFAPLPLYSFEYTTYVDELKRARGVRSTRLDSLRTRLLSAFEADSQFEVLHFIPLYFSGGSANALIEVTRAVSEEREPALDGPPAGRLATQVLQSVLSTRAQKRILGDFVTALEAELAIGLPERTADHVASIKAAQEWWDANLAARLAPFLASHGLHGGVVLVSPAIGPEGRVFRGAVQNVADNVAAVGLVEGSGPHGPAFSLLREICYPVITELVTELGLGGGDRYQAERISSRGAVRCGNMVIERYAPEHAAMYRLQWLRAADNGSPPTVRTFETTFPIPPDLHAALTARLDNLN